MTHVADTTPYPWPFDGVLDPARLALVVTGWDGYWHAASPPSQEVIRNIRGLAAAVAPSVVVGHRPGPRWPATGTASVPSVDGERVSAEGVDGFYGSGLEAMLRRAGVDHLLLAGVGLETTVHSTLRTANDAGLECLVVIDACQALAPDLTSRSVSMIEMSGGIFGAVGTTANVLAALAADPTSTETAP